MKRFSGPFRGAVSHRSTCPFQLHTRLCALIAAAVLLASCAPARAAENRLVVGNPTPMQGEFFTDLWGNATSDIDVRDLLHGYNLIVWDGEEARFTTDPTVVVNWEYAENEDGDHVYTFVLNDALCYSDGGPITAWDYAFSFLLLMSPELGEIGARPLRIEQMKGYREYISEGAPLSGVRVMDDHTLCLTLDHEYLPFFYELGLLRCNPYPIFVIAPGVEVRDDGEGVYLANIDDDRQEPLFTPELLQDTILDPEFGYMSHPDVVSGPYILTLWDGVTAEFEINPYYLGNARGELPSIPYLTYTLADNDTMIGQLENGEFGLLNKVTRFDAIKAGAERVDEGVFDMTDYPRTGFCYISFACERLTVASKAVRQAIAWCMDRDQVTRDYAGDYGVCVDGFYGIGQWMYGMATGLISPPADENGIIPEGYDQISLDGLVHYHTDTEQAARLLDEDGWVLNEDGIREKDGVVLDLKLIYPEGNNVSASLQTNLADDLALVGIRLTMEAVPMGDLLSMWYQEEERDADMIYLASNFYLVFDPSVHFMPDGSWAYTNLMDEGLYHAAVAMRRTEPENVLGYLRSWVAFQEQFNESLPMIPIYGNYYVDFFESDLKNYRIYENVTWSEAIVGARLGN